MRAHSTYRIALDAALCVQLLLRSYQQYRKGYCLVAGQSPLSSEALRIVFEVILLKVRPGHTKVQGLFEPSSLSWNSVG